MNNLQVMSFLVAKDAWEITLNKKLNKKNRNIGFCKLFF